MSESTGEAQVEADFPADPATEVTAVPPRNSSYSERSENPVVRMNPIGRITNRPSAFGRICDPLHSRCLSLVAHESFELASTGAVEETGRLSIVDSDFDSGISHDSAQDSVPNNDDWRFEVLSVSDAKQGETNLHDGTGQVYEVDGCSVLATGGVEICIKDATAANEMVNSSEQGSSHESDKFVTSQTSVISCEDVTVGLNESECETEEKQNWELINYNKGPTVRDTSLHRDHTMEESSNGASGEVFDDKSSPPAAKRKLTLERSSIKEASSDTLLKKVSRNNHGELLGMRGSQTSETERKEEAKGTEAVSRRQSFTFSDSSASYQTCDAGNQSETSFDVQENVADRPTTPFAAEVVSQTENAKESVESSTPNENEGKEDNGNETSSEEDEALPGERLDKVCKGPYASGKKSKSSVAFQFDVDCDIFELGLNEEELYCGVVIAFENATDSQKQFYAGGCVKQSINYEEGTMTVKGYIPKKEFEGRRDFSVMYAVSEIPDKNVCEQSIAKLRMSQTSETRHEFVSGLTIVDNSGAVQKFTLSQHSREEKSKNPGIEAAETGRETTTGVGEAVRSEGKIFERRENQNKAVFDTHNNVADSSTTPFTAEVGSSQIGNAEKTVEKSASTENEGKKDYEEERSSEEEEEALPGERLEQVRKGHYAKKSNSSIAFQFDVDCDIFELGLNEEELYCGVVIAFENATDSKKQFYAGGGGKQNINYKKGTMTVKGYIPKEEFEGKREFSVMYAVSESPDQNVCEQSSDKLRMSRTSETRHAFMSGLTIGIKSGTVVKFIAGQLSKEGLGKSRGIEATETGTKTNTSDRETIQTFTDRNRTVTGKVVPVRKNQRRHVNVADTTLSTESNVQTSTDHSMRVSNSKIDTSLDRKFSRIQSVDSKNVSGDECLDFKFFVGLDIFELGFKEQEPLYCGVAIMTEKDRSKSGKFYPGTKLKIDPSKKRLAVQVLISKSKLEEVASKHFFFSYAIASSERIEVAAQNADLIRLSKPRKVTDVKNAKGIEAEENAVQFEPSSAVIKNPQFRMQTGSKSDKTKHEGPKTTNIESYQTSVDDCASISQDADLGSSSETDHHLTLKEIVKNATIDKMRDEAGNRNLELNALFGSDICLLNKRSLMIGVCESSSNFTKIIPGYIVDEIDGNFWVRFRVEVKDRRLKYKYVVADHIKSPDTSPTYEKLHKDGEINRSVSVDFNSSNVRYDGLVRFVGNKIGKGYFNKLTSTLKSWNPFSNHKSENQKFYEFQNYSGLSLYLSILLQSFIERKITSFDFRDRLIRITDSLAKIETEHMFIPYVMTLNTRRSDMFVLCFELLLQSADKYKMNSPESQESFECQMSVAAIFLLMAVHNQEVSVLSSAPKELYVQLLEAAKFKSAASKATFVEKLNEHQALDAVHESCQRLLEVDMVQSGNFAVLFEWMSLSETDLFPVSFFFSRCREDLLSVDFYASDFTKVQLLALFWKSKESRTDNVIALGLPVDKVVLSYFYVHMNDTVLQADKRFLSVLLKLLKSCKQKKDDITPELVDRALVAFDRVLGVVRYCYSKSDRVWTIDLTVLILDFLEMFEICGVVSKSSSFTEHLNLIANGVCRKLECALAGDCVKSFDAETAYLWGGALRSRSWPHFKHVLEQRIKDVFLNVLKRQNRKQLYDIYLELDSIIMSKGSSFDPRGLKSLFDETVIYSFHDYLNHYSGDFDHKVLCVPELQEAFAKIATGNFPEVTGSTHHYEVVQKMVEWKPFISLLDLAHRSPAAKNSLREKFNVARRGFRLVVEEIERFDISSSDFAKIMAHSKEFQEICKSIGAADERQLKSVIGRCQHICENLQHNFQNVHKLKELLRKFRSSGTNVDISELDEVVKDWQHKSIRLLPGFNPTRGIYYNVETVSQEENKSVDNFLKLFKSRLFSKWAIQSVKNHCDSLQEVCHYSKLLNELLPYVEKKYLERAESLVSGRLNAKEAHSMFHEFKNEQDKQEEIGFLFEFLKAAVPPERRHWIEDNLEERKGQVLKLDSLNKNLEFVTALNELKQLLEMEGNFAELDILANVDKLDQYEMRHLTPEILKYSEEFVGISREQVLAIKSFTKCPAFLSWIRQKMPSLQDVKVVAELASLSAGEIAYEIDKVQCFHDAVFGYAPFIYELNNDSPFADVKRAYEKVFAKLETDKDLPSKYEDSAHHQSWFEKALESQGSVEKSSLERALQINKSGCYIVGYRDKGQGRKVLIEQEDAVVLEYQEDCKSADGTATSEKRTLDLTELRDLLSRLMLIVGKDKHEHAPGVDIFIATFQNVERLATSFVALFNSGCSFFDYWFVRITSDKKLNLPALQINLGTERLLDSFTTKTNEELSCLCVALESIKSKWEQYVFAMRCKRPVLNEFNTQQLKTLCSGLAAFKKSSVLDSSSRYYIDFLNDGVTVEKIEQFLYEDEEDVDMNIDDEMDGSFATAKSLTLEEITRNPHIDERSHLLTLIDSLKSQFNDNESLAKAAIQAVRVQNQNLDEAEAINWIVTHEDQDEIVTQMSADFDQHFSSLDRTENTEIGIDTSGNKMDVSEFAQKMELVFDKHLSVLKENRLEDFVNLFQLGHVLDRCLEDATVTKDPEAIEAPFPEHFKRGKPNLVLCDKRSQILLQLLSLYRHMSAQTLPKLSQVLVCSSRTSVEEVEVFLLRSLLDKRCRVFCMAFVEDLSATCADHLEKLLFEKVKKHQSDYKLVVFSCDESCQVSVILEKFKTKIGCESLEDLRSFVRNNLRVQQQQKVVDDFRSRLIWSSQPSSGKSLHIDNLEADMKGATRNGLRIVHRLFDRVVDFEKLLDFLWLHKDVTNPTLIHLDVSPNVVDNVEELLFKLCVLGGLSDERGKMFLLKSNFCLLVELLRPQVCSAWKSICDLFPSTACLSPNECLRNAANEDNVSLEFMGADVNLINSAAFQRSYHYLEAVHDNRDITNYKYNHERQNDRAVIETLKRDSGLSNPTWAQLSYFAQFLNEQLEACENNVFVNCGDFTGLKNFLVKHCLIKMAQDFALPSLSIADNSPLFGLDESNTNYQVHQIRRRWENHPHPYVFFNADQTTLTFLGVRVENSHLKDCKDNVLARNVMSADLEQQIRRQEFNESNILDENFDELSVEQKQMKLCRVLGVDQFMEEIKFDSTYELTQDNVMKLLAIYMRFRCNIPVVIMGETGCGKTRLIEFLCQLMSRGQTTENKKFVKVHGGLTMADITRNIEEAEKLAAENTEKYGDVFYTVLFFDEANTTEAIYGIKEVICDFSVSGRKIDPNSGLKVIVACNPYRKHDENMIKNLESQGLGYHVKSSETKDKLDSDIPMRHLVYRVNPLPPSLLPLVWDFGQLTSEVENKYIRQIVEKKRIDLRLSDKDVDFIVDVLSISQKFLRTNRDQCLFVSLRDIERAMTVLAFFYFRSEQLLGSMDVLDGKNYSSDDEERPEPVKEIARLVILTLGVCYHSSLENRGNYRGAIGEAFKGDYALPNGAKTIERELELCMEVFLDKIVLDAKANIAKNLALSENVFMMIICIELRIPLFLVGKPGSSKSLAKTIVLDAMQGEASKNEFFRELKQVQMLSFQCSPHTHADGIISTFKQAALFQKGKALSQFVSVVLLDEIGLAEDSAKMPLKTLHPLLEEGYVEEGEAHCEWGKVAFVGISNWALDPAKMNRGILVSRTIPTTEELVKSANGICRTDNEGKGLERLISPLAQAYEEIYKKQMKEKKKQMNEFNTEYFGLRDFYGLLKMLYRRNALKKSNRELKWSDVRAAIRRNFGEKTNSSLEIFAKHLRGVFENVSTMTDQLDTLELVKQNIQEAEARSQMSEEERSMDSESRYLLLMTENFSALQLLPQVLNLNDYEIIFGSSFPQDQEYIQVCKNINRIKICMETGRTVVLLNLGSLYESLYDALNQYYSYYGGKRYVDLGLGSNRVKCSVSENFRLIMIEEEKVAMQFPIPLLNRLEKHFLVMKSILPPELVKLETKLSELLQDFSQVRRLDKDGARFRVRDAFVGYQQDTIACVLIQCSVSNDQNTADDESVLSWAEFKLVQTCSIEAILRADLDKESEGSFNKYKDAYLQEGRKNLAEFLWLQCYSKRSKSPLIEVSTFRRIPSSKNIKDCNLELMKKESSDSSQERHFVVNLNVFKTEIEFAERIKDFYRMARKQPAELTKVLFVTCSKGQRLVHLIASAKYCLQNLHTDAQIPNLFTLFIVELPRYWYDCGYSSFSVGKWESFHIDELFKEQEYAVLSEVAVGQIRDFRDLFVLEGEHCSPFQRRLLREVVHEAVADSGGSEKVQRVSNVFRLFEEHHVPSLEVIFLEKASRFIETIDRDLEIDTWVAEKTANLQELIKSGTIENALFTELKAKIKPHLADFLKSIDFNNNIKLLFEGSWRKTAWMQLFNVKELCRMRLENTKEVKFDSKFPFSTEVIQRLNHYWNESMEIYKDHQGLQDWQFFVERFQNQGIELFETLKNISHEEDAIGSFVHDLAMNKFGSERSKFVRMEVVKLVKNAVKSIMAEKVANVDEQNIGVAYAVFMKLSLNLPNLFPVLREFAGSLAITNARSIEKFSQLVLASAVTQLKDMADKLKPSSLDNQKILDLESKVHVVKASVESVMSGDDRLMFTFKRVGLLSTYLSHISHNLGDAQKDSCTAADTLYISGSKAKVTEEFFGGEQFFKLLLFCLSRSAEALIRFCVERETGTKDCSFCKKTVAAKGAVPLCIPCPRRHVVHEACLKKAIDEYEDRLRCTFCKDPSADLNREMLSQSTPFNCRADTVRNIWSQFWENISGTFLRIVEEFVIPNGSDGCMKQLTEMCLIYKGDNDTKHPHWFTESIKRSILTLISVSDFAPKMDSILCSAIQQDKKLHANCVDLEKTNDFLLSAFEYIYDNFPNANFDSYLDSSIPGQLRLIAYLKMETRRFIAETVAVNAAKQPNHAKIHVPNIIREFLQDCQTSTEAADCLRHYFVQCVCREHGMVLYEQVKKIPELHQLIPQILLTSQSQGFTDIFLVLGNSYQNPLSQIYQSLLGNLETAMELVNGLDPFTRSVVVYRLTFEIARKEQCPPQMALFRDRVLNREIGDLPESVTNPNHVLCPLNCTDNLMTHFLFLEHQFLALIYRCGPLQPFKHILNNNGNVQQLYLPTFPDSLRRHTDVINQAVDNFTTWNQCPNGHLYLIGDCGRPNTAGRCPDCGASIGGGRYNFHPGNATLGDKGQNVNVQNSASVTGYLRTHNLNMFERNVTEFTGNVMQFFIHTVLYLSTNDAEMLERAQKNVATLARNVFARSEDDVFKFLISLLISSPYSQNKGSFVNEDQREMWEQHFTELINQTKGNLERVIAAYDDAFKRDSRTESNNLIKVLDVAVDARSTGQFLAENKKFWVRKAQVSVASLNSAFNAQTDEFPLLKALFKNEPYLEYLSNIPDLFWFFDSILGYYDSDQAHLVKTFDEFVRQNCRIPIGDAEKMKQVGELYCKLWNSIVREKSIMCQYKDPLSFSSPLRYFLPSSHVNESCALAAMDFLVAKNNELVEAYRRATDNSGSSLVNGSVRLEHVVSIANGGRKLENELVSTLSNFASRDETTNTIHFDFGGIERSIGRKFFRFKPILGMQHLKLKVKSSSTKVALNKARIVFTEDEIVSGSDLERIQQRLTDMPEVCRMLRQLVLLMKYLEKNEQAETIGEFLGKIKIEAIAEIENYHLKDCVALWQALALQKTCLMMQHDGEEPYPGIMPEFRNELSSSQEKDIRKMRKKNKQKLMLLLNEFVSLNLDERDLMKPEYHIERDCLDIYFYDETGLELPHWMELRYAESVMKFLVNDS